MTAGTACSRCGADVESGARFCMSCGSEVVRPSAPTLATPPPPANESAAGAADHYQQDLIEELRRATLGDYEILTQLGQGGMATVYLAHDIQLDRKVAIKVMSPALLSGQGMVERFKLEARTAAKLSHPHIIPIYAVKEVGKMLFFIMKFVEGRPLDSIIKELGKLPLPMMMTIITKVGEALGYAHRNGVVHRDIKPANIMIDVEGLPMVTDFGIAKVSDQQGLTMTGATIGTPTYMSPEQCASGKITGASDQYSLGILSYEMLTGTAPFHADSLMTIMYMHCNDEPPEVTELRTDCPPPLRDAVLRMLAKHPDDRWPSMEDMVAAVGGATTLAFNDPVRTQLVGLAMAGESHRAIERISTPRSPMPLMGNGHSVQASHAATVKMPTSATVAEGETKKGRSKLWLGVGGTVIAGVAIALGIFQPWASTGETGEPVTGRGTPPLGVTPVVAAPVMRLDVTPASATLRPNLTQQFVPQAFDSSDQEVPATFSWKSTNPDVAQVTQNGLVTALAEGHATITAAAEGVFSIGSDVTVRPARPVSSGDPPAVAAVRILGARDTMLEGMQLQLTADALDASRVTLSGRDFVWRTNNLSTADVDQTGLVTARSPGSARITATSEGVPSDVLVYVRAERVTLVALSPRQVDTLGLGGSVQLTATAVGERSAAVVGRTETWESSDRAVATVQNGDVQARGVVGSAFISVTIEGRRDSVEIVVEDDTPLPVDSEGAVRAVVEAYEEAFQLKDLKAIEEIFPNLPSKKEREIQDFFDRISDLRITITVEAVQIVGDIATVRASQHMVFRVGNQTIDRTVATTLELRRMATGGWVIAEMSN
jgi:serine/threonine protein kinase/ketosteroid isomerase-like protein